MLTRNAATVSSILKVGAAAGAALTMVAGMPMSIAATTEGDGGSAASITVSDRLDQAAQFLADKQVVKARSILLELNRSADTMSSRDQGRLNALLSNASKALKALPAEEVSLQTAADAMTRDELVLAERHAKAVIEAPSATNAQSGVARDLLTKITARRELISDQAKPLVTKAVEAFDAGNTAQAKALLTRVSSAGMTMDAPTAAIVADYQTRIVLAEEAGAASASMMQPGVIKPVDEKADEKTDAAPVAQGEPAPQPAAQPPAQPANNPELVPVPAGGARQPAAPRSTQPANLPPVQDSQPAAQPQPETQPAAEATPAPAAAPAPAAEPAPAAAPAPAANDPIQMARQLEAQSLLATADKAFEEGRMNEAVSQYDRLLREFVGSLNDSERAGAELRASEARARLNAGGGNLITSEIDRRTLQRQQVLAEYENDMERARRALEERNTSEARTLVAQANLRINAGRSVLAEPEFEEYAGQVRDLRAQIDSADSQIQAEVARQRAAELQAAAIEAQSNAQSAKERKIAEAVDRVRALQREMKYGEAMQVTEQILFLDPINPTGLLLRDILADMMTFQRFERARKSGVERVAGMSVENTEALLPPIGFIEYPSNWPQIFARGDNPAFSDSEEDRRVLSTLQSRRIPVAFNDTPLANVLEFFKTITLLNMDVDWQSLENVGISRDTPVTLNLSNVTVETALSRVAERVSPDQYTGAAWSINDGVLTIASREVINRNKALVIYDIRDLIVEVPDYLGAPDFDLNTVLQQGGGQGGGGGGRSPFEEQDEDRERRTLEERTNEIIDIITTNVDTNGWQQNGGDVGMIQQLGGNLIITNTPANHRAIHNLLGKLRSARAVQINVETRFLLVSQDFFEQVGFDIDVYFNAKNNQVRAARATDPNFLPSDFFDGQGRYTSSTIDTTNTRGEGGIRPGVGDDPTPTNGLIPVARPSPLSVIGAPSNSLGITQALAGGEFASGLLTGAPALGVSGQFLDDLQVDFLIKATQADRRTVTLTAPRLTFTNGQTSNIYVATQQSFIADLTPVVADSAVGFDPEPGVVTEGVVMLVDGTVTADRRYVVLNIDTTVGTVDGIRAIPVTAVAGGQLVNSDEVGSNVEAPTITVTRVQTTVTVPDQGTILLGGQRLVTEQEVESGVPVLSKIPIINRFFTNRVESREEQSLLILLKPTILIQSENEDRAFPGLNQTIGLTGPN